MKNWIKPSVLPQHREHSRQREDPGGPQLSGVPARCSELHGRAGCCFGVGALQEIASRGCQSADSAVIRAHERATRSIPRCPVGLGEFSSRAGKTACSRTWTVRTSRVGAGPPCDALRPLRARGGVALDPTRASAGLWTAHEPCLMGTGKAEVVVRSGGSLLLSGSAGTGCLSSPATTLTSTKT